MFPSYLPVKAPDPGAYHFNFLGHNQKCLTGISRILIIDDHHISFLDFCLSFWNDIPIFSFDQVILLLSLIGGSIYATAS